MSVVFDDFLRSAETLAEGNLEIDRRNAVSRAYYGSYHCASHTAHECCPDNSHLKVEGGVHERLIDRFNLFPKTSPLHMQGRSIAIMLTQLKTNRRKADYDLDGVVENGMVQTHIETAKRLIKKIESLNTASKTNML